MAPLADVGAVPAGSPERAAADLMIIMLADEAAVRAVVLGPDGLARAGGGTLALTSTVGPAAVTRIAREFPGELLDAPVTGSVPEARAGRLRLLVGGAPAALAAARPVLAVLGEVVHVGPVGAGSALKLVLNAAVAPLVGLLAESLALADRLGLDQALVLDELSRSRIGPLVARKRERIESGHYPAESRLGLFGKDLDLILAEAAAVGAHPSLVAAAARLAAAATAAGLGELDYSALVAYCRGTPAG